MKDATRNNQYSGDTVPIAHAGYVGWEGVRFNTATVRLTPLCRCGDAMREGSRVRYDWGPLMSDWRCPRRRWWNAWRHPDAYTLRER